MKELTQQTQEGQLAVIHKIFKFKQAVVEGDIEKRSKAEAELREALEEIGLDERLIKYLIGHFKRSTEIEKAYEEKCRLLQEVRETIRELARRV
jgi:DNA-binding protein H-NS